MSEQKPVGKIEQLSDKPTKRHVENTADLMFGLVCEKNAARDEVRVLQQENARLKEEVKAGQTGGWISVEERLPDGIVQVSVLNEDDGGRFPDHAFYNHWLREWRTLDDSRLSGVTHWRELPPLPATTEEEDDR